MKIGVLITYFNEAELLTRCLNSLADQTRLPDEILIYDNASELPASDYVPAGSPARVIRGEKNRGPSYARNALAEASRSDYVHFHDSDDFFHPDWCRSVARMIAESGADVVFTEVSLHKLGRVHDEIAGLRRLNADPDLTRFCIRGPVGVQIGTFRRSKILPLGGFSESLWQAEDTDWYLRLAESGVSYVVSTDSLVNITYRPSSLSQGNRVENARGLVTVIAAHADRLAVRYGVELAEKAVDAGIELFRRGAVSEAKGAFRLARELGPPTFDGYRKSYRLIARSLGPEAAERLGSAYRRLIPKAFRTYLAEQH